MLLTADASRSVVRVWIPAVAGRGLVLVTRDRRGTSKPAEAALLRRHGRCPLWFAAGGVLSS
jgi:hypothetical protein